MANGRARWVYGTELLIGIVVWFTLAGPARAALIFQGDSFSLNGGYSAVTGFQEFDPTLGTLDSVNVDITGILQFFVELSPGQSLAPIVDFDAAGTGGRGFDFAGTGARLILPTQTNTSTTGPMVANYSTSFSLAFNVNAHSELIGYVAPTLSASPAAFLPPSNIYAQRDSFIEGLTPVGISEALIFSPVGFPTFSGFVGTGQVLLNYDYTPAADVDEPSALTIGALAIGLLMLLGRRRMA